MKIILFIGHHKVGSTALQDFFSRNQVALMRAGILYPSTDFQGMSLALATATGRFDTPDHIPLNSREPHNALAFRMLSRHKLWDVPPFYEHLPAFPQMKQAIRNQIQFLNPHTVILAAEVFSHFGKGGAGIINELIDLFPQASEITICATLRRIDEYLASWHGQRLHFGHKVPPMRENGMDEYFNDIHFDYRKVLRAWFDTLPEARFVLRDYSDVRSAGGSVADFAAQTGLTLPSGLHPERKSNESLHRGIYEIVRLGNHALDVDRATHLRDTLRNQTPKLKLPPSNDIELFGAANRDRMQAQFAPVHDYLSEITGQQAFFKDISAVTTPLAIPEREAYEAALEGLARVLPRIADETTRDFLKDLMVQPSASTLFSAPAQQEHRP